VTKIVRSREWAFPPAPVHREVLHAAPEVSEGKPPVLFVPGFGHGAWAFGEHWLERTAARGFPAYAMSLRGHGYSGNAPGTGLRAYVHDVVQVAASLPRQAVLVGHGAAGLVVARALSRYPAKAGVLVSPALGGWRMAAGVTLRNPGTMLAALFGRALRPRRGQLFSRELPNSVARGYARRVGRAPRRAQWELLVAGTPELPVGEPPVLIVGSPDDKLVPQAVLSRAASWYGGAPLLFPGMGHDLMLDARWAEPIDAILDWLHKD
jgi:pimeloyl-ACP methyl ester carboxylesterase